MKICSLCGVCCRNTEMELSMGDISEIEKQNPFNWTRDEFCEIQNEYYTLKNSDGHCIFLNPNKNLCNIYDYRPQGCRFYPMLYDPSNNQCLLDDECPHRHKFYHYKPEYQNTCKKLRKWYNSELLPSQIRHV